MLKNESASHKKRLIVPSMHVSEAVRGKNMAFMVKYPLDVWPKCFFNGLLRMMLSQVATILVQLPGQLSCFVHQLAEFNGPSQDSYHIVFLSSFF
jgi:hypothetical protein